MYGMTREKNSYCKGEMQARKNGWQEEKRIPLIKNGSVDRRKGREKERKSDGKGIKKPEGKTK